MALGFSLHTVVAFGLDTSEMQQVTQAYNSDADAATMWSMQQRQIERTVAGVSDPSENQPTQPEALPLVPTQPESEFLNSFQPQPTNSQESLRQKAWEFLSQPPKADVPNVDLEQSSDKSLQTIMSANAFDPRPINAS